MQEKSTEQYTDMSRRAWCKALFNTSLHKLSKLWLHAENDFVAATKRFVNDASPTRIAVVTIFLFTAKSLINLSRN